MTTTRPRPVKSTLARAGSLLIGLAITLAMLEAILQVAAFGVWLLNRSSPAKPQGSERVILCMGDSYTFGFGASSSRNSYPAVLEGLVRDRGGWRVVNAGWPGRNSRDVLLALESQLAEVHPSLVYILIGVNDGWSKPKRVEQGEMGGRASTFQWRFRTARLAALVANSGRTLAARAKDRAPRYWRSAEHWFTRSSPSPVGEWLYEGTVVGIHSDGLMRFNGSTLQWRTNGDHLDISPYNGSSMITMRLVWALRDGRLILRGEQFPDGLTLDPVGNTRSAGLLAKAENHAANGAGAIQNGDWGAAQRELRAAEETSDAPDKPWIIANLARAYAHGGKRAEAEAELAKLRAGVESSENAENAGQTYISLAEEIGEGDQALAAAHELVRRYPANATFYRVIAWESFQRHDIETATTAIDEAVHLTTHDPLTSAFLLQLRASIYLTVDPRKSFESAVEAYLINPDRAALSEEIKIGGSAYSAGLIAQSLDGLQASAEARRVVLLATQEAVKPLASDAMANLDAHLRLMIASARRTGAAAVLISYPFPSDANSVMHRVAQETGAGWIDAETEFTERLKTARREDLFAADGHLNDRGYAILASMVASDAGRRPQGQ